MGSLGPEVQGRRFFLNASLLRCRRHGGVEGVQQHDAGELRVPALQPASETGHELQDPGPGHHPGTYRSAGPVESGWSRVWEMGNFRDIGLVVAVSGFRFSHQGSRVLTLSPE